MKCVIWCGEKASENLIPCPFCAGTKIEMGILVDDDDPKFLLAYYAHCVNCESDGPPADTLDAGKDVWNRRPKHDV